MKSRLILAVIFILSALATTAQTRRALVIGLGEQLDPSWQKINGDRDVPLVVDMLKANGFKDITTLVNSKATKKSIVRSLCSLSSRCRPGDIVYIHFSGHGQKMTDLDGDELDDNWDESWIPYDAFRTYCLSDRGEKHLSDDELHDMLTAMSGKVGDTGSIVVSVDACHSGDATRGPAESLPVIRGVQDRFVIPDAPRPTQCVTRQEPRWVTLSACRDYQLNAENPAGYGSLTFALHELWPSLGSDADNATVALHVKRHMKRHGIGLQMPQTPDLTPSATGTRFSSIFLPSEP